MILVAAILALNLTASTPAPALKNWVEQELKDTYRQNRWTKFFGYAQYYRAKFSKDDRTQIELLEGLALLRHCQTEALAALSKFLVTEKPYYREYLDQMNSLARTRFKGKSATVSAKESSALSEHLKGTALRKLDPGKINKVDPRRLQVRVENLCE